MATEQEALRHEIAQKREEITDDLNRLEDHLRWRYEAATDWRGMARRHPLPLLGVGAAFALLLGLLVARIAR